MEPIFKIELHISNQSLAVAMAVEVTPTNYQACAVSPTFSVSFPA
jgi:hypothetical protein